MSGLIIVKQQPLTRLLPALSGPGWALLRDMLSAEPQQLGFSTPDLRIGGTVYEAQEVLGCGHGTIVYLVDKDRVPTVSRHPASAS